jgi:hypothetical protein
MSRADPVYGNAQKYVYECPETCANKTMPVDFLDKSGPKSGYMVQRKNIEYGYYDYYNPESAELTGNTGLFVLCCGMKIAEGSFQVFNPNGRDSIHG